MEEEEKRRIALEKKKKESNPEEKNIDKNLISNTDVIEESAEKLVVSPHKNIINFWDSHHVVLFYEYLLLFNKYILFTPLIIIILFIIFVSFCNNIGGRLNAASFITFNLVFIFYLFFLFIYSKNSLCNFYLYQCIYISELWPISISFGIDNVNIFFILLTAFLFPLCILINWNLHFRELKLFIILIGILEILLILSFMSTNLLAFFFFFESTLIPMYFIISLWGSRQRKVHASFYFFVYTAVGSVFILLSIFLLFSFYHTLDIRILYNVKMEYDRQLIIFLLLFLGFAVKIPIPPFHLWLPEAHVEASTAGSVILAGVLLKLGTYGIFRFVLPLCPDAAIDSRNIIYAICSFSVLYISCIAIRQTDLKKIIAYSSIAHMSFVVIGLFSFSVEGFVGSFYLMISHGIVSAALFSSIGILYERTKTREIIYYKNVIENMPKFSFFFFIFILANIGFPFTSGFISEFIIINAISEINLWVVVIFACSTLITSAYSIWLYSRITFFVDYLNSGFYQKNISYIDINKREFYLILYPFILIIILGLFPNIIIYKLESVSAFYLNKILI